jgi:MFS family permease
LANGILADALGRQKATLSGVLVFLVGVIIHDRSSVSRFIIVVSSCEQIPDVCHFSSYNAELAPAELRGSLVSLQQLAICFGILVSYWIGWSQLQGSQCGIY